VTIFEIEYNSQVVVGEVNHQSIFYTFSKFFSKSYSTLLLIHSNDDNRLWH
jgi:hypothetical protein